MEPTNHPFGKENHLPNLHEDMFHVNLPGCNWPPPSLPTPGLGAAPGRRAGKRSPCDPRRLKKPEFLGVLVATRSAPQKIAYTKAMEKKIHDFLGWNLSLKENKNIWKKQVKNPHFKQQLWWCHSLPGKTVNPMAVFRWKLPWSTWPASIPTPLLRMASSKVARSHRCEPSKMDGSQGSNHADGLVGTLRIGLWGTPFTPPKHGPWLGDDYLEPVNVLYF